jgi:hypothetical protein
VLAFLGGYSVEMLFTAMDRLVHLVAGRVRPSHRSQVAARPPRGSTEVAGAAAKRTRIREMAANGAPAQHAANPVPMLAPVRAESG